MTTPNTPAAAVFAPGVHMHHATRKKATALAAMFAAEYPMLELQAQEGDERGELVELAGWAVCHGGESEPFWTGDKVPELADVVDAAMDADLSLEAEEEEPKLSGSVVPETYRQRYREVSSNGQTNGDWLAEWLVTETNGADGFRVPDFEAICVANGLDMTKGWALLPQTGSRGWVGRYRMNGRQVLEKVVAKVGYVLDAQHTKHTPPEDFLTHLREKHAKWLAKEAKREAAAEAAAGKGA